MTWITPEILLLWFIMVNQNDISKWSVNKLVLLVLLSWFYFETMQSMSCHRYICRNNWNNSVTSYLYISNGAISWTWHNIITFSTWIELILKNVEKIERKIYKVVLLRDNKSQDLFSFWFWYVVSCSDHHYGVLFVWTVADQFWIWQDIYLSAAKKR